MSTSHLHQFIRTINIQSDQFLFTNSPEDYFNFGHSMIYGQKGTSDDQKPRQKSEKPNWKLKVTKNFVQRKLFRFEFKIDESVHCCTFFNVLTIACVQPPNYPTIINEEEIHNKRNRLEIHDNTGLASRQTTKRKKNNRKRNQIEFLERNYTKPCCVLPCVCSTRERLQSTKRTELLSVEDEMSRLTSISFRSSWTWSSACCCCCWFVCLYCLCVVPSVGSIFFVHLRWQMGSFNDFGCIRLEWIQLWFTFINWNVLSKKQRFLFTFFFSFVFKSI